MAFTDYALFQLSTKIILQKDNKILVLQTPDGWIDFPGGRMDESEKALPLTAVLQREVSEELGQELQYTLGPTAFVSRRQYTYNGSTHDVALVYILATYKAGTVQLSDEHATMQWLTPAELLAKPQETFISADEYTQLKNFF